MPNTQFRILFRQFLFRIVDPELLSPDARGDMTKLFGQFAALLIFLSLGLAVLGFGIGEANLPPTARLVATWSAEHFLIATTMLVVGLFAVLSWDATFPDQRDVFVLAPLPVPAMTIFLAKLAAVATALSITVAVLNILPAMVWPFALNREHPAMAAPAITYDPAMPPLDAANLKSVLDHDLEQELKVGFLAPGNGGGVSIGVWKHGVKRVFAYGTAKPDSIFEIGSVTKTFTGLLLARAVVDGKMRLDQPLRELLPPGLVTRPTGSEVTLLNLITHRSGLRPDNVHGSGEADRFNSYSAEDMYSYVHKRGLAKPRYVPMAYSNFAVALLGQAMADHAGTNYETLVQQQITAPLGMHNTVVHLSPEQQARLIQGYSWRHRPVEPFHLDALAPAGAIRSTAGDMLLYLAANLHPELLSNAGALPAALTLSHKPRAPLFPGWDIGLAWFHNIDLGMYLHEGGTSGYTSSVFFVPEGDYAAVVLVNAGIDEFALFRVLSGHIRARLAGEPAISLHEAVEPASGSLAGLVRLFAVYWIVMFMAGAFIFCCVLGVQGLAAQLLPRQLFLRASSFLQLAAFALFVSVYFLEPQLLGPGELAEGQNYSYLEWCPAYWFLGLFQQLNGSPALAPLAIRAWICFAIALSATAVAYSLAYLRTMRKIAETPDIASGARKTNWIPAFGNPFETAIGRFSIRTLLRSRQHRLLVAFYLGIGFAAAVLFPKWPPMHDLSEESGGGWTDAVSLPLLGTTILLMALSILGIRAAFALPINLRANWIFRVAPIPLGPQTLAARRRAFYALAVAPVLVGSAALLFSVWPWQAAAEHLLVLALLGAILAELGLRGIQKIPFACSYLPGKSNFHITFLLCMGLVLSLTAKAVQFERRMFEVPTSYAALVATLAVLAILVWWRNAAASRSPEGELQFEDAADPAIFGLDLYAARHSADPTGDRFTS